MQDEASAGYDAYSILLTGKDHHGHFLPVTFQAFNDWIAHSFVYQTIPFIKIFGLSVFSIRFSVAFLSIITIIIIYLLAREISGNKKFALLSSYLFSLSLFSITSSRWAIPPNTVPFYVSLGLFLLLFGLNRKNNLLVFLLGGIVFGLTLYTYPSVEVMVPVFLLMILIYIFIKYQKTGRRFLQNYFFLCLTVFIFSLPLIANHLQNPQTITNRFKMISLENQTANPIISYIYNYLSYFTPSTLFLPGEINPNRTVPGFGYENPILGIFYYLGLFYLFLKTPVLRLVFPKLDHLKIFLIRSFVVLFPLIPSLTLPPGDFQRASHFMPVMIIISGLGIFIFINIINKYFKTLRYLIFGCMAVFYFAGEILFLQAYFGEKYATLTKWYFQNGMDKVVEYTQKAEKKYDAIIVDNTINQPYIYFLFYGKIDPRSLTENNYENLNNIDPKTNWLKVEKFRNFEFRQINDEDIRGTEKITSIYNSPFSNYGIYTKNNDLLIKFEHFL